LHPFLKERALRIPALLKFLSCGLFLEFEGTSIFYLENGFVTDAFHPLRNVVKFTGHSWTIIKFVCATERTDRI